MDQKGGKGTGASCRREEGLRELGLLKKALGDLTSVLKYLLGGSKDEGVRLCSGQEAMGTRETTWNSI